MNENDDLQFTRNALTVLESRYLARNGHGQTVETPKAMFRRVARAIAKVDHHYDRKVNLRVVEEEFFTIMASKNFLPNSPTLMNAGLRIGQLSACFVLPVEDSIAGIFDSLRLMASIQQSGGGTGFSFSRLRPRNDIVESTMGTASGPTSFMELFDKATDVVKQGGRRRGANMGVLDAHHPDIIEFIRAKESNNRLTNFNISVAVTDDFMQAVYNNDKYSLVNPRTGKEERAVSAIEVFDLIAEMAWKSGDPGVVFIDEINRKNPTPKIGRIESTNPCGEQPLLPYESCNLGSINLAQMLSKKSLDWDKLRNTIRDGVHFLDNVIDANVYSDERIERVTKANRKIGLGVMGFADMLAGMGIRYDSMEALEIAEKVMRFITEEARLKSIQLAEQRGSFPNFNISIWKDEGFDALRNATITTIAPTGTISIIAGCSSSIEPLFAICFVRNVLNGTLMYEINPLFESLVKERGVYSTDLVTDISKVGSVKDITEIPDDVKNIFVTAYDITPAWHVRVQAAFQKWTDNAVSKTVNLPHHATVEDVKEVFKLAHVLKCKGITVYREGSKEGQVLSFRSDYSGGCLNKTCPT
jgi:ribonucleoside-diphosphate reductase alpha chain